MSAEDKEQKSLSDLLADQATQGLSAAERKQLDQLLAGRPDDPSLELTAATIQLAEIVPDRPLPLGLKGKLMIQADEFFRQGDQTTQRVIRDTRSRNRLQWRGWMGWALAALILVAVVIRDSQRAVRKSTLVEQRQALLLEPGTQRVAWTPTNDPAAMGISGDVVWNERLQRGYMSFHNLAENDPRIRQYQLWIFAENQDERFPVDGGVFDVPKDTADVIVPITPGVHVAGVKLLAVTLEKAGGVVVSKRERVVSLAKVL